MESLEKAGKNVTEFFGIMANPTYAKVLEGAELARKNKIDLILGVGGGSVMNCCKAISLAAVYDGDIWTDLNVTIWNISWALTRTAVTERGLPFYILPIIGISTGTESPNLKDLRSMCGEFPKRAGRMKRPPLQVWRRWRILFMRSDFQREL